MKILVFDIGGTAIKYESARTDILKKPENVRRKPLKAVHIF